MLRTLRLQVYPQFTELSEIYKFSALLHWPKLNMSGKIVETNYKITGLFAQFANAPSTPLFIEPTAADEHFMEFYELITYIYLLSNGIYEFP